jgi:hypothetical protein
MSLDPVYTTHLLPFAKEQIATIPGDTIADLDPIIVESLTETLT